MVLVLVVVSWSLKGLIRKQFDIALVDVSFVATKSGFQVLLRVESQFCRATHATQLPVEDWDGGEELFDIFEKHF